MTTPAPDGDDRIIGQALLWSTVLLSAGILGAFGVSWRQAEQNAPHSQLTNQTLRVYPPGDAARPRHEVPAIPFTDITAEAGIDFVHDNGAAGERLLPEAMGGGCLVFDYDLDGNQDVLLIHSAKRDAPRSSLALYRYDGDGRFREVTEAAGLTLSLAGMGGVAGDFDNDGWPDLFLTAVGSQHLLRNLDGRFQEITDPAGLANEKQSWSMAACWIDFDHDGDLDLFAGNYLDWSADLDRRLNCCWNGVDRSYCDPDLFEGTQPRFFRNEGDGRFENISAEAGIEVRNPDTGQPVPKILAAAVCDLNQDHWPDLVATCDGGQNLAYLNSGQGSFQERAVELGLAFDRYGRAVRSFGIDVACWDGGPPLAVAMGRAGNAANALYLRSSGDAVFTDRALAAGFGSQSRTPSTFGLCFVDADLDGRLDLLAANGQIQENFGVLQESQSHRQAPQLLWRLPGDEARFQSMTVDQCGADLLEPLAGRAACYADFDSDGDLDLLLNSVGGPPRLLRNDQQLQRNWLRISLHGRSGNRDALGSLVEAQIGSQKLVRSVSPVGGYLSQHERAVVLGLDRAEQIDALTVTWPDGEVQTFPAVAANQSLTIIQGRLGFLAQSPHGF